ncbi:MAG: hypothetical protein GIKADHBN_02682 [Phycisphaerales bacterium]|nr:hypothetical protein [Phycisphaerales bacterium]
MSKGVSRRTVLRGLGVTMALPWLEAMTGQVSIARGAAPIVSGAAGAAPAPTRMAFIFMPNGVNYESWAPTGAGAEFSLSPTLEPLAPLRKHFSVVTGLTLDKARANGDGPGDHARSSASFLTGHQARKTAGNDIRIGVSVDQFAARQVGGHTRLPSIELGCENSPSAGNCDSGYSCAYTSNISWREADAPMPKMVDPSVAFERLFGDATQAAARQERLTRRQSILDFVLDDTKRLERRLGGSDRRKLEQFQTSVREVEQRVERARAESGEIRRPELPPPDGVPATARDHIDLMYDLLLLAFQMDVTRIGTLMVGVDGSNRTFPEIGITEGHHHLSHHQNNQEMIEKIRLIDRFHVERFGRFMEKLAATPDGEGTLLDHSMIVYGGGISDGNRHNHEDLPILVAGRGGGTIYPGRLIATPRETPLCNLYVSLLERMGCEVETFGDSTGRVESLTA